MDDVISNHNSNTSVIPDILTQTDIAMQVAQALKRLALAKLETTIVQAVNRHGNDDILPAEGMQVTYAQRRDALDEQMASLREAFGPHVLNKVDELLANQE